MKIFKSIKWRLQLWYGLILLVVLMGFGLMAYQLDRNRQFNRVDQELHRRVGALAQQLHRPPRERQPNWRSEDRPPLEFRNENQVPPDLRPPKFNLTPQLSALFDPALAENFYFIIRGPDNREIAKSTNQPAQFEEVENFFLNRVARLADRPQTAPRPVPLAYSFSHYRNVIDRLPSGEIILVGCSIIPELKELHRTALNLTIAGGLILLVGLAGGGWLVNRALRPVSEISATAVKISAGDLSQRINPSETESELGQLAAVLNSTFARLEAAFAQQKQFASDAAHELRTPVSVILTQTQTSLNRERDAESYKQTVAACQRAAQRMRKLIESLLELARFDAGQEVLNRASFDLAQTVADSVEMVQPLAEEFQVKLISELSSTEITGDAGRLGQVVTNLLSNAIQYNQPGGEVRVQLTSRDGLAVLTVADTGQGIAPEDLPRVFERFYRADSSRTGGGNAGLGLSICKAIVEAHGGTIEVASEKGKGSVFTVQLPAV
jgi:heavy metal sensor kinase